MDENKDFKIIITSNENNNGYLEYQCLRKKYFRPRVVCGYKYYYSGATSHYDTSW